nr:ankyrin repeat domain-containing protein [Burkholderia ambifaria]
MTLTRDGKTYALNGQARARALENRWIDGKTEFDPPVLLQKIQEGLQLCDSPSEGAAQVAPLSSQKNLQSGPDSNRAFTAKELINAANDGDLTFVKRYIATGNNVNALLTTEFGTSSAIGAAAASGHCEVMDFLLKAGAAADPVDKKFGFTPLSLAAGKGAAQCIRLLVNRHVRLDVRTEQGGDTALIIAAYRGNLDVTKLLVEAGASLTLSNRDGDTPYRAARAFGNVSVAQYLRSKGGK